jgi:glycosidase
LTDDAKGVYAFLRNYRDETIIVVVNRSDEARQATLLSVNDGEYLDLLHDNQSFKVAGENLSLNIDGLSGRILLKKR